MTNLKHRLERIEREAAPKGRSIVISGGLSDDDVRAGLSAARIDIRPADDVLRIRRFIVDPPTGPGGEPRREELFRNLAISIDGKSVPLVRETA